MSFLGIESHTGKYRCMWRSDPATTMVVVGTRIGYDPVCITISLTSALQITAYRNKQPPDRIIVSKGMNNHYVRLSGSLIPFITLSFRTAGRQPAVSFKTARIRPTERLPSLPEGIPATTGTPGRQQAGGKLRPHASCSMAT